MFINSFFLANIALLIQKSSAIYSLRQQDTINIPSINYTAIGDRLFLFGQYDQISFFNSNNDNELSCNYSIYTPNTYGVSTINETINTINNSMTFENLPNSSIIQLNDTNLLALSMDNGKPILFDSTDLNYSSLPNWQDSLFSNDYKINTFYLDDTNSNEIIYLGGDFLFNNSYHGVAAYDYKSKNFINIPFEGFGKDGYVNSIIGYNEDNELKSLIFGGKFTTLGNPSLLSENITLQSNTSTNSSSAVYVDPNQLVSLKNANVYSLNAQNAGGILCPNLNNGDSSEASDNWILPESQLGEWRADLPVMIQPSKLRLYNLNSNDGQDGIEYFRLVAYPVNGIMNLSYIDPETLQVAYCDAYCPLLQRNNLNTLITSNDTIKDNIYSVPESDGRGYLTVSNDFQEFGFVNPLDINSLNLQILSSFNNQAGLSGLQIYQYGTTAYANDTLNQVNCDVENFSNSQLNDGGVSNLEWVPGSNSEGSYIQTDIDLSSLSTTEKNSYLEDRDIGVTFRTNVSYAGNYTFKLFTPGCIYDDSCDNRAIVNASLHGGDGSIITSELIYQTNNQRKYDIIFNGYITDDILLQGMPYVSMSLNSQLYPTQNSINLVADSLQVDFLNIQLVVNNTMNNTQDLDLNGLFEYSLTNFSNYYSIEDTSSTNNTFIGNSSINLLNYKLENDTIINDLYLLNDDLIIASSNNRLSSYKVNGYNSTINALEVNIDQQNDISTNDNNSTIYATNLLSLNDSSIIVVSSSEDNNDVSKLYVLNENNELTEFNNGNDNSINGSLTCFATLTYNKTDYLIFNGGSDEFKIYNYNTQSWYNNSNYLDLNVTSSIEFDDISIVFGSIFFDDINSHQLAKTDIGVFINNEGTIDSILEKSENANTQSLTVNDVYDQSILAGSYVNNSYMFIGGHFELSDDSTNLLIFKDNNTIESVQSLEKSLNYSVNLLYYYNDTLYISTIGSESTDTNGLYKQLNSLLVYNVDASAFSINQPKGFDQGFINSLEINPRNDNLLVGGSMRINQTVNTCKGFCSFDKDTSLWENPINSTALGKDVDIDEIYYIKYIGYDQLLLSGNLTIDDESGVFGLFNLKTSDISLVKELNIDSLPNDERIEKFAVIDKNNHTLVDDSYNFTSVIAITSSKIIYFDGESWSQLNEDGDNDQINDFQILPLNSNSSSSTTTSSTANSKRQGNSFNSKQYTLLISGNLSSIDDNVSAAFFDGSQWIPYLSTDSSSASSGIGSLIVNLPQIVLNGESDDDNDNNGNDNGNDNGGSNNFGSGIKFMSDGNTVGVACALAVATLMLFGLIGALIYLFTDRKTRVGPLESRIGEEKMMKAVPPTEIINNLDKYQYP
ncbi:hypothetical protein B5S33_g3875 [[Candida] boidinii]|nr:hypothetical protein B5S30_g5462 [[Candida] boidinii]OWB85215.1 hypothetical protein B5S33_g3875 [[Candida] boidinii]GMF98857.1 unnamed protein product [[Candida] boidinii]